MEDSMSFWKGEFTKKISAEKFEKEYAYNIRHNYGKEGNKRDYDPKNCNKIILGH
jgi:DNA primase large subunit